MYKFTGSLLALSIVSCVISYPLCKSDFCYKNNCPCSYDGTVLDETTKKSEVKCLKMGCTKSGISEIVITNSNLEPLCLRATLKNYYNWTEYCRPKVVELIEKGVLTSKNVKCQGSVFLSFCEFVKILTQNKGLLGVDLPSEILPRLCDTTRPSIIFKINDEPLNAKSKKMNKYWAHLLTDNFAYVEEDGFELIRTNRECRTYWGGSQDVWRWTNELGSGICVSLFFDKLRDEAKKKNLNVENTLNSMQKLAETYENNCLYSSYFSKGNMSKVLSDLFKTVISKQLVKGYFRDFYCPYTFARYEHTYRDSCTVKYGVVSYSHFENRPSSSLGKLSKENVCAGVMRKKSSSVFWNPSKLQSTKYYMSSGSGMISVLEGTSKLISSNKLLSLVSDDMLIAVTDVNIMCLTSVEKTRLLKRIRGVKTTVPTGAKSDLYSILERSDLVLIINVTSTKIMIVTDSKIYLDIGDMQCGNMKLQEIYSKDLVKERVKRRLMSRERQRIKRNQITMIRNKRNDNLPLKVLNDNFNLFKEYSGLKFKQQEKINMMIFTLSSTMKSLFLKNVKLSPTKEISKLLNVTNLYCDTSGDFIMCYHCYKCTKLYLVEADPRYRTIPVIFKTSESGLSKGFLLSKEQIVSKSPSIGDSSNFSPFKFHIGPKIYYYDGVQPTEVMLHDVEINTLTLGEQFEYHNKDDVKMLLNKFNRNNKNLNDKYFNSPDRMTDMSTYISNNVDVNSEDNPSNTLDNDKGGTGGGSGFDFGGVLDDIGDGVSDVLNKIPGLSNPFSGGSKMASRFSTFKIILYVGIGIAIIVFLSLLGVFVKCMCNAKSQDTMRDVASSLATSAAVNRAAETQL